MLDGIKYIFQIPMEWFLRVERFITGFYSGTGIELRRDYNGQTCVGLDKDQAVRLLGVPSSSIGDEPLDKKDLSTVDDLNGEEFTWEPGGTDGIVFDVVYKFPYASSRRWATFVRLTFSKDGLLVKAEGQKGRRKATST